MPFSDRRSFLALGSAGAALLALRAARAAGAPARLRLGAPVPFSYDALVEQAQARAAQPYRAPAAAAPQILDRLDYETLGHIRFRPECALFADGPGRYPVEFFHLGRYSRTPVRMHVVEGGMAREAAYDPALFDMPADSPARALPANAGYAGFRLQESRFGDAAQLDWRKNDWVAFLGASYFRAIGELYQYGLSARGLAVDTAVPGRGEEFPVFTNFYFQAGADDSDAMTVCATLDGPSVAGAYRFVLRRGRAVITDVQLAVFLRADVAQLGIAPLTSMYWYSETTKPAGIDWRPEVHDSDGLAMWTGGGEHIWRPLVNPPRVATSVFLDENPRGFGLLQRDRNFDHYRDGVYYDRRPSLWAEPLEAWGAGAVQLVEIPTNDEINDNVVAMWVPSAPARAGAAYRLRYRLHWSADEPYPTPLARCVYTAIGRGGQPGQPRPPGVVKFAVEFLGAPLAALAFGVKPEPVVSASAGRVTRVEVEPVADDVPGHWRAFFDLAVDGPEPVDVRLFLRSGEQALSETWLYRYQPPA